jgi:FkbM family methyltransferase
MKENQTITKKYNFKVKYNQHGGYVNNDFVDEDELILIDNFEQIVLKLKDENIETYSMVELGSNQAYYSLLFKSILNDKNVKSIMVEPHNPYLVRGVEHFEINNYPGIFINKSIGNEWVAHNTSFNVETISVDEIVEQYNLDELSVLHSDIDGSEIKMLLGCEQSFLNKKIKYAFILTHGLKTHLECLNIISKYDYNILLDHRENNVGCDSLIIIEVKK